MPASGSESLTVCGFSCFSTFAQNPYELQIFLRLATIALENGRQSLTKPLQFEALCVHFDKKMPLRGTSCNGIFLTFQNGWLKTIFCSYASI